VLCFTPAIFGQEKFSVSPAFKEEFSGLPDVRDITISAGSDEFYFTILSPLEDISIIAFVKKAGIAWSNPEMVSFSGKYRDLEPFLSPDGLRLYFSSDRPLIDTLSQSKDFDIWYVERENLLSEWSKPINQGIPVNSSYDEFYPSLAKNKNIYFTSGRPDSKGNDDIWFCNWLGKSYSDPVSLSDSVNSSGFEYNSFIAPDESYIIFGGYNKSDGMGSGDLYISFKKTDQTWSIAKNLGPTVNSRQMDYCPFVDLHTNTLYFTSKRSEVKLKDFHSVSDFIDEITIYQNGNSRIYKIPLKIIQQTDK
jgi:hypothetical protein